MNDMLVGTSRDTRPFRTYLTTLLSYGSVAKESRLAQLEGWVMDEVGKYNNQEKEGLVQQRANGCTFDFKAYLHLDMLFQD